MGKYSRVGHTATVIPGADAVLGTGDDEIFVYGGFGYDRDDMGGNPRFRTLGSGEIIHGLGTLQTPDYTLVLANDFYPNAPQVSGVVVGMDPTPRTDHFAGLLSDGSVIIGHGTNEDLSSDINFSPGNNLSAAYEVFTPDYANRAGSTFSFNAIAPTPPAGVSEESLIGPGAVVFAGDRVLVAGGYDFLNSVDPTNPDPTALSEEVFPLAGPTIAFSANSMAVARANYPFFAQPAAMTMVLSPGVDLILGTLDDRAVIFSGVLDNPGTTTASSDFFVP